MNITLKALLIASTLSPSLAMASDEHKPITHTVGVFTGVTINDGESDSSYGLEYEYKLNQDWGVGLVYEKTPDAHHEDGITVTLASVYAHPTANWRIGFGVGQEKIGGHHSYTKDLIRTSVAYDFHLASFGIAPSLAFDVGDGDTATVVGLAFTKSF